MGLEAVEIVMAVEEKFGISIPDEDAEKFATPGDMTDYIFGKVQHADLTTCLSQRAFHLLRQAWMTKFSTPRKEFSLGTRIEDVVPHENRRILWADLGRGIGATSWPSLERPRSLVAGLVILTTVTFVGIYIGTARLLGFGSDVPILLGLTGGIAIAWTAAVTTRPFRTAIPSRFGHIKDLVEYMVARNTQLVKTDSKKWTREEVWCAVREIVIEVTGIHDFTEKSHFVKDIGIS